MPILRANPVEICKLGIPERPKQAGMLRVRLTHTDSVEFSTKHIPWPLPLKNHFKKGVGGRGRQRQW